MNQYLFLGGEQHGRMIFLTGTPNFVFLGEMYFLAPYLIDEKWQGLAYVNTSLQWKARKLIINHLLYRK